MHLELMLRSRQFDNHKIILHSFGTSDWKNRHFVYVSSLLDKEEIVGS